MKILITGGAGFIGSHLAAHLGTLHEVTVIDDLSTGTIANIADAPAKFVEGSILDRKALDSTGRDFDAIVHLAARPSVARSVLDPLATNDVNVLGTLSVLEFSRRMPNALVVIASSSSVYGANPTVPRAESLVPMPMSPYAVSKLAAEQYALAWGYSYGARSLVFRFFNVYGPGQTANHPYAAVVPAFLAKVLRGENVVIYGDGKQTRDFTYVKTVCRVISKALESGIVSHEPINLAYGTQTSLLDLVHEIELLVGREIQVDFLPARTGDVRHSQADAARFIEKFGDIPSVDLRDGIRETLQWMSRNI